MIVIVKVRKDLTGMVFGRLKVLKQIDDYITPKGLHHAQWLCECSCEEHNIVKVTGYHLTEENGTRSCGCISREKASQRMKDIADKYNKEKHKTNKYDLSGDYGIGWTTNTNRKFYFDLEDYDKIKDYCWFEHISDNNYHSLCARVPDQNQQIRMNWIIIGKFYDHINRNPFDNRKTNLRPATQQENARNSSMPTNNTSGFIGVCWDKRGQRWVSYIGINNKNKHCGYFINKHDAIVARLKAELEHYGADFAPQRHLFKEYGII